MSEDIKTSIYFVNLVISLSQTAMQQLGKIANHITGNVEKNLEHAKTTIDMLEMLKEKTKGNLTKEEDKMIKEVLSNLQLNYVDEATKDDSKDVDEKEKK